MIFSIADALEVLFAVPVDAWFLDLTAIGFAVLGARVLIVVVAPMDFGTRKAAASATGFIDGWGYLGVGLQSAGTGLLVDRWGWNASFASWIVCAFLTVGVLL